MPGGCWKLVRDRIGEELEREGRARRAGPGEMERLLLDKIVEEALELAESGDPWEAADLYEALTAWLQHRGLGLEDLQAMVEEKRRLKGGFAKGYVGLVEECRNRTM